MKLNEVKISIGKTINMGNYESSRIDFSLSAYIEDGDVLDDVISKLRKKCKNELDKLAYDNDDNEYDGFVY